MGAFKMGTLDHIHRMVPDHYEAERDLVQKHGITAVRFLEQVQPVWRTPWPQLMLGTSLSSQSLTWEQPFTAGSSWGWRGGIQTQTLLPRGLILAGWWRGQHLEVAGGLSLLSGASWRQPDWRHWQAIPTLGLSLVRSNTPG